MQSVYLKNMTLEHITKACGGIFFGTTEEEKQVIAGAVTDSRQVEEGYLFIPVKGARADGHDFIPAVFAQGAIATLSEKILEKSFCPGSYILVESTLQALKEIARVYRQQLDIPVIGITGSVGKTSTKEMMASVLSVKYNVLKTAGNFNNEIGLPLTLLRIREEHQVAVVEMGISDFGEMTRLAQMAQPTIGIITNIGSAHLENLKDRNGIRTAKTEMFDYIQKDGLAILNGDDDKLAEIKTAAGKAPIFYGIENQEIERVKATNIKSLGLEGTRMELSTPAGNRLVEVPIPGRHNIYNALASAAVGLELGLTLEEIKQGIAKAKTIGGRNNIIKTNSGLILIDDCYNANPASMKASLDLLAQGLGRKIAVLGDMGELGEKEKKLHYEVGAYAGSKGIDTVFCTGELSSEIARGARNDGMEVYYFPARGDMLPALLDYVKAGDTILVKASHFMEYEKLVEELQDK